MTGWTVWHDMMWSKPQAYFYGDIPAGEVLYESTTVQLPAPEGSVSQWFEVYLRSRIKPPYEWMKVGWVYTSHSGKFQMQANWKNQNWEMYIP